MGYVRLSIVHPRRGQEGRVLELMKALAEAVARHPGCTSSQVVRARDAGGDVARITMYIDETAADATANDNHIMALRSELHLASESQMERSFDTV